MNYRIVLAGAVFALMASLFAPIAYGNVNINDYEDSDYSVVITGPFEKSLQGTIVCRNHVVSVHIKQSNDTSTVLIKVEGNEGNISDQLLVSICVLETLYENQGLLLHTPIIQEYETVTMNITALPEAEPVVSPTITTVTAGFLHNSSLPNTELDQSQASEGESLRGYTFIERVLIPVITGLAIGAIIMVLAHRS